MRATSCSQSPPFVQQIQCGYPEVLKGERENFRACHRPSRGPPGCEHVCVDLIEMGDSFTTSCATLYSSTSYQRKRMFDDIY